MANIIKTNTDRLRKDCESVNENIKVITDSYKNLIKMKVQLDAMWDGFSSDAFQKVFVDDIVALMMMVENLNSLYNYTKLAKDDYEKCEKNVRSMIAAL